MRATKRVCEKEEQITSARSLYPRDRYSSHMVAALASFALRALMRTRLTRFGSLSSEMAIVAASTNLLCDTQQAISCELGRKACCGRRLGS